MGATVTAVNLVVLAAVLGQARPVRALLAVTAVLLVGWLAAGLRRLGRSSTVPEASTFWLLLASALLGPVGVFVLFAERRTSSVRLSAALLVATLVVSAIVVRAVRPSRTVVAVGDPQWVATVAAVAPGWNRTIVARLDARRFDLAQLPDAQVDELVVSPAGFVAVAAAWPYEARPEVALLLGDDASPSRVFASPLSPGARAFKRLLDIALASLLLVLLFPVLLGAIVAIKANSRGPVLFSQMRPGLHGRAFPVLKLRTMRVANDDSQHRAYVAALINGAGERQGGMYKLVDDPRLTRVGRTLRRYSVDELPQLVNVLRGEMSLVGPRPSVPSEVLSGRGAA